MDKPRSQRVFASQLSAQLQRELSKLTNQIPDVRLQTQIDDAVQAVCRCTADALAAERAQDVARFVRMARAAISDIQNGLRAAVVKRALDERDLSGVRELLSRLYPALSSLLTANFQSGTPGPLPSYTRPSAAPSRSG